MELDSEVIDYTAESVTVLENGIQSVQERPHMYIGSTDTEGVLHLILELVANSIDQFLAKKATLVRVTHQGLNLEVFDDGGGFPVTEPDILKSLTEPHDTPTVDGHAPHIHLFFYGLGLFVVNALSESFVLETVYQGRSHRLVFAKGHLCSQSSDEPLPFAKGTKITLRLDEDHFEGDDLDRNQVRSRLFEVVHLFPGLILELNDERFRGDDGLLGLAEFLRPEPPGRSFEHIPRFRFHGENDRMGLEVACIGRSHGETKFRSWANGTETPENGTHVLGALQALSNVGWIAETVLVSVVFAEPNYAGPKRDKLRNKWVTEEVRSLLEPALKEFLEAERSR